MHTNTITNTNTLIITITNTNTTTKTNTTIMTKKPTIPSYPKSTPSPKKYATSSPEASPA